MALFSRRHYEFLADFLHYESRGIFYTNNEDAKHKLAGLTTRLARELKRDNPAFNEDRFFERASAESKRPPCKRRIN